jgi:hypothetical protein
MKFCTIRIDIELYEKIKKLDQTGRGKFTSGLMFIIQEFFKGEKND